MPAKRKIKKNTTTDDYNEFIENNYNADQSSQTAKSPVSKRTKVQNTPSKPSSKDKIQSPGSPIPAAAADEAELIQPAKRGRPSSASKSSPQPAVKKPRGKATATIVNLIEPVSQRYRGTRRFRSCY